jgi:hypothetical protein
VSNIGTGCSHDDVAAEVQATWGGCNLSSRLDRRVRPQTLHACGDFFSEPDWDNTTFRVELFAESLWQEQNPKRRF